MSEGRKLLGASLVYGFGAILVRGLTFVMLPFYTRWLTPADYGIIGLATSVSAVLGVVLTLGLNGALSRFWFGAQDDEQRARQSGTIVVTMLVAAVTITGLVDLIGTAVGGHLFRDVAWSPYMRTAIWSACLTVFGISPTVLLQVRQRPLAYVLLSAAQSVITIGSVIVFVVGFGQGAAGYLRGLLIGNALLLIPNLWITFRHVRIALDGPTLRDALKFGLPLVPHNLGSWALSYVDRAILERNVTLGDLGIYSLGFQAGTVMSVVSNAANSAWGPYFYAEIEREGGPDKPKLSGYVTFFVSALAFVALGLASVGPDFLVLVIGKAFAPAAGVVPWIVLGNLFSGLYVIPGHFLFAMKRTKVIPFLTLGAAIVSVATNVSLIPTYGIRGACWSSVLANATLLIGYLIAGRFVLPFPYEVSRLLRALALGAVLFALTVAIGYSLSPVLAFTAKLVVVLAYPVLLVVTGVLDRDWLKIPLARLGRRATRPS